MLRQMQIAESPQSIGLSLRITKIGCIVITGSSNGNSRITVVNSLIHQIPGKCSAVIGRHHHIVKLIGRVEAIHRT